MSDARRTISIAASRFNSPCTIDVWELGPTMDGPFEELYKAYLINERLWPRFAVKKSNAWNTFMAAAEQYFGEHLPLAGTNSFLHVEHYFENFNGLWQIMFRRGMLEFAERLWETALEPVLQWEANHPGERIHKGTPYYFWAMTALLRGDADQGFLLAHQALDEDKASTGQPKPDLPAYALVSLNHQKADQAFKEWVDLHATFFEDFIKNYSVTFSRALTMDAVKRRFMDTVEVDTVFLFTHALARLRKISNVPHHVVRNSFAAQLQINLLFDLTLVIDSAIKARMPASALAKNPKAKRRTIRKPTFIDLAECLLNAAGHRLTNQQLREVCGLFSQFDKTLTAAVGGQMSIKSHTQLDRLQCDIAVAYGLRNRGAHNVATSAVVQKRFHDLEQAVFRVLCATIDYLY